MRSRAAALYRRNNCFFGPEPDDRSACRTAVAGRPIAAYRILSSRVPRAREKKQRYTRGITVPGGQPGLNYRVNNDRCVRSRLAGRIDGTVSFALVSTSPANRHRSARFPIAYEALDERRRSPSPSRDAQFYVLSARDLIGYRPGYANGNQ